MATRSRPKGASTTRAGYRNRNGQVVQRRTNLRGNDHLQWIYVLKCSQCAHEYGANGSDIFQRRCPRHQGGAAGLPFRPRSDHS